VRPGQLVNRRTCPWYLDDLREQCAAFRGFLFFAAGRREKALECYKQILDYDPETRSMEASGIWNDYRRLKWGAEHGHLYAYPQEHELYTRRQRLAVLLGDFYYVTQQFDRAAAMARRLLEGEFKRLSSAQRDYPQFLLGSALYRSGRNKEAYLAYVKVLGRWDGTFTEDRAAFTAGNLSELIADEGIRSDGQDLLRALAFSGRRNEYVEMALLTYASRLIEGGRIEKGMELMRSVPESADYYAMAQYLIGEYARMVESGELKEVSE
jgi:tetratricopeptide (TPR) repeat protein